MSDFLSRVAARAVGEAPVARPRLPALFERPEAAEVSLEVVDEEVIAPAASAPALSDAPAEVRGAVSASTLDESDPRRTQDVLPPPPLAAEPPVVDAAPEQPQVVRRTRPESVTPPALPIIDAERDERAREGGFDLATDSEPAGASEAAVRTAPAVGVPATPAVPKAAPAAAAAEIVARPRDEQPAVRVHIGRLEVRANLQPAPAQPPRREDARSEGLSLADYLRGKREVG